MAERGMGRGLAAILPMPATPGDDGLQQIPLNLIRPNAHQPRAHFAEVELQELADSIAARGVLQPVLVRPIGSGQYELIAGERRWRASRMAGLDRIPAMVRATDDSDRLELALIENMAREDLNPVEAARACAALVDDLGMTKEEVGKHVGRSRAAISNLTRLLDLPDEVLTMLEQGELSEGHGKAILQAPDRQSQRKLAREARDRGLSVREVEALARSTASPTKSPKPAPGGSDAADARAACSELEDQISRALGYEAKVGLIGGPSSPRGAKLELRFSDLDELRTLAARFERD